MNEFDVCKVAREEATARVETILRVVDELIQTASSSNDEKESLSVTVSFGNNNNTSSSSSSPLLLLLRTLYQDELDVLSKNKCQWDNTNNQENPDMNRNKSMLFILQEQDLNVASILEPLVSNTRFDGWMIFDMTNISTSTTTTTATVTSDNQNHNSIFHRLAPGIHSNLLISNSIIKLSNCRVYKNGIVSHTYIGTDAIIVNCGQISGRGTDGDRNQHGLLSITVGAEAGGGRPLLLTPEATMKDVTQQLRNSSLSSSSSILSSSSTGCKWPSLTFVSDGGVMIRDTPVLRNLFLHPGSAIHAASSVCNALLFPGAWITNASVVSNVVMQWDCSIIDQSNVHDVLLMEQSHIGPSSTMVASSVLGPDTHVSAGEVHHSVVGPNTNAHHQSLLISVLWPHGRGNVGYGANVGSNHTGRLPDQEAFAGEGLFWGLSCVVKFPVDFTDAPYSIVAAGTQLDPAQRIRMPFSLLLPNNNNNNNNNSSNHSTGNRTEIVPGWVWQSSLYTIVRNDDKYATRRKAKRHAYYTGWKIVRPATVQQCRRARRALQQSLEKVSTEPTTTTTTTTISSITDVEGIGTNLILTERGRDIGIEAYTNCIQRYALKGLLDWTTATVEDVDPSDFSNAVQEEFREKRNNNNDNNNKTYDRFDDVLRDDPSVEWPSFPWEEEELDIETPMKEWDYQRYLLLEEFPLNRSDDVMTWITTLLEQCVHMEQEFARRVAKSKARDDVKGTETIPGYAESHVPSEQDPVVVKTRAAANEVDNSVQTILSRVNGQGGRV
ncbi:protein of unknown function DUF4864 containing protein [Nitzschia inconspicua]|uniref:Uncharacterized protein n=1 Tax=Nitzschia inconspicua TaxID=303405 RepID=A0A9K3KAW0_9STRA|nr:protein of unknown function DUF4864 containing protein [Nitzschia inconspicua]